MALTRFGKGKRWHWWWLEKHRVCFEAEKKAEITFRQLCLFHIYPMGNLPGKFWIGYAWFLYGNAQDYLKRKGLCPSFYFSSFGLWQKWDSHLRRKEVPIACATRVLDRKVEIGKMCEEQISPESKGREEGEIFTSFNASDCTENECTEWTRE